MDRIAPRGHLCRAQATDVPGDGNGNLAGQAGHQFPAFAASAENLTGRVDDPGVAVGADGNFYGCPDDRSPVATVPDMDRSAAGSEIGRAQAPQVTIGANGNFPGQP